MPDPRSDDPWHVFLLYISHDGRRPSLKRNPSIFNLSNSQSDPQPTSLRYLPSTHRSIPTTSLLTPSLRVSPQKQTMKISIASIALAMLAEIAVARNCNGGLKYCGSTLLKIGKVPRPRPPKPLSVGIQTHRLTNMM